MLPGGTANALHDPGNYIDLEPSEHAGRRNLRRKGQKREPYKDGWQRIEVLDEEQNQ